MKKRLLLGTALLAAVSAFPQSGRTLYPRAGVADYQAERAKLKSIGVNEPQVISPLVGSGQTKETKIDYMRGSAQPTSMTWDLLCGSMNTYGMIVSSSRPLQYNPNVNAVSFIHRKSLNYAEAPALPSTAESGVIVAEISTNWGASWDSTALWVDATHWGRYPQGGIYAPPSTSFANAHVVGSGPTVSGSTWTGNWYASKPLSSFSASQNPAPNGAQFIPFVTTNTAIASHGWSRNGFSVTDDGLVRSIGVVEDDLQGLSTVRGFAVATGTFNNGVFDWSTDTLIPNAMINSTTGNKYLNPDPQMAFNQSGTIGYVVAIGVDANAVDENRGQQPIIWKMDRTTNPAATWTQVPSYDFTAPAATVVTAYLAGNVRINEGDTIGLPFTHDYDITVDMNGKLHIGIIFMSGASDHPDSLNYYSQWSVHNNPGELYRWRHSPGNRPYLYDLCTDGVNGWNAIMVDSVSSEGPSAASGYPGYTENPWDNTGDNGAKVGMDTRIQLGRTPAGDFLTYAWVESDSAFTNGQLKWNNMPNIKVRSMQVHADKSYTLDLGPEQNMTLGDPDVYTRATLHYMSPTSSSATLTASNGTLTRTYDYITPMTVTNSNPYSQLTNNITWYGRGVASFVYPYHAATPVVTVSVSENNLDDVNISYLYPNPTSGYAVYSTVVKQAGTFEINVINAVGQTVKSSSVPATAGENKVRIDLTGLSEGIYFVNVKSGSNNTTKKLIIK